MKQPISEMSTEELKKKQKLAKTAVSLMGGMILVMAAIGAYLTAKQGFSVFTVLPVVFLGTLAASIASMKQMTAELKKRGEA